MTLFIFIYGVLVFAIVAAATALIAWGILTERRDRSRFEQASEVFGEVAASAETGGSGATAR